MPVFSFPEEAELFLCYEASVEEWEVRETDPDDLLLLLLEPRAGIKSVSLDPLPDMVAGATLGLVSVSREEFVERLTGGRHLSSV